MGLLTIALELMVMGVPMQEVGLEELKEVQLEHTQHYRVPVTVHLLEAKGSHLFLHSLLKVDFHLNL